MLAHFEHPFAHQLDIPKIAEQRLAQACIEALSGDPVLQAIERSREIVGTLYREHTSTVTDWLQSIKRFDLRQVARCWRIWSLVSGLLPTAAKLPRRAMTSRTCSASRLSLIADIMLIPWAIVILQVIQKI